MNLSDNKILITGGASGIGLGLAERFIQENNTVIICGRRASLLEEVKAKFPSIITKVCDLSIEEERIALYQWIAANHPDLNVLVNNAPISTRAGGVGIQMKTSYNNIDKVIAKNSKLDLGTVKSNQNIQYNVPLSASYYQTDSVITPGKVNSVATVTIQYE